MDTIAFGVLAICALAVVWVLICNQITYRQRVRLIDYIYGDGQHSGDWVSLSRAFRQVSYDTHLQHLATFRDPRKLYPSPLSEAF